MNKKKVSLKIEPVTVLVIPASTRPSYTINISPRHQMAILGITVVFIIALVIAVVYMTSKINEIRNINAIMEDSVQKSFMIEQLETQIHDITRYQMDITNQQEALKKMMGLTVLDYRNDPSRGYNFQLEARGYSVSGLPAMKPLSEPMYATLVSQAQEIKQMVQFVEDEPDYYRSIPNLWPMQGEISSPYGWRDVLFASSQTSFHHGLDIANEEGTPVYAAGDGIVKAVGRETIYGLTVTIDHEYDLTSKYAHNSVLLVTKNQPVQKGQIIARCGNTGQSTGPHLHFEVRRAGQIIDPASFLP